VFYQSEKKNENPIEISFNRVIKIFQTEILLNNFINNSLLQNTILNEHFSFI